MTCGRRNMIRAAVALCVVPQFWHPIAFAIADAPIPANPTASTHASIEPASAATTGEATSKPARIRNDNRVRRWWFTMTWGLVLIVTFLAGSAAIVVFSRRFRDLLKPDRREPTPDGDVWAMHVAPPPDDDAFGEFENRTGQNGDADEIDDDEDDSPKLN